MSPDANEPEAAGNGTWAEEWPTFPYEKSSKCETTNPKDIQMTNGSNSQQPSM